MKSFARIMIACTVMLLEVCFGSELDITLEQKVQDSDIVVLATVTSVELGNIRKLPKLIQMTQDTKIHVRIDECIFGNETGEISIEAHSVSFVEGDTPHMVSATAGFTNSKVKNGVRFIAYLKKVSGRYLLTGESNQFLELIDDQSKQVSDTGQTNKMVDLEWKKVKLRELALKKKLRIRPNRTK
jgi:hypothetical protein